ncbi:hypothetical protein [Delftia acidovorans]
MSKPKFSAMSQGAVRREVLTPSEFRKLLHESPELIARSRFIAPVMGKKGFGNFEVQYTIPRLKNHQAT